MIHIYEMANLLLLRAQASRLFGRAAGARSRGLPWPHGADPGRSAAPHGGGGEAGPRRHARRRLYNRCSIYATELYKKKCSIVYSK